ncbi:MAG: ribonuclease HIII [Planctomycetota bacterium]|nr:ribonuclease HIII [Planctomycetota bacterium]
MAQRTVVLELDAAQQDRLREEIRAGEFELRSVEHAHFSARAPGIVATLYLSGKLVVQGVEAELFVQRFLGDVPPREQKDAGDEPLVGGDESGKGDYFGPLVVAAVRIGPGDAARLRAGGVADSKKVADGKVMRLGASLRGKFPHAIRSLDPPEYNRRHAAERNVALILAALYREVVEELFEPGVDVLIDQFSKDKRRLERAFEGLDVKLHQRHHAESSMAVAAASILAREAFLRRLAELSEEHAIDLPKGAGPPVLDAGRRFLVLHGPDKLDLVAKTHFKTTQRLLPT